MSDALKNFLEQEGFQTNQTDSRQVKNNAGGYVFKVDNNSRLQRFLILGVDGGTYYSNERDLTKQNLDFVKGLIKSDPHSVLNTTVNVSKSGRAYRNNPAILVLAMLFKHADKEFKPSIYDKVNDILRTSTHLFKFCEYVELMGGWSRGKRRAVANWYTKKNRNNLAYQLIKYRQREGWTHRDALRLSHATIDPDLASFAGRWYNDEQNSITSDNDLIGAFHAAQLCTNARDLINVLDQVPLPWEALPTQLLKEPEVWKKLFYTDQLFGQALVRNITRLSRISAFDDIHFAHDYSAKLADSDMIYKTRLHPIQYLNALLVQQRGQANHKKNNIYDEFIKNWESVPIIMSALEAGFYKSFGALEPVNKKTLLALDVSSSMTWKMANGLDMWASEASAAMAMVIARTAPDHQILGFSDRLKDLGISADMPIGQVLQKVSSLTFGGTDCSLPPRFAKNSKMEIETFITITDNETWAGPVHTHTELQNYRQNMDISARMVVVGVSSTDFTIADPTDSGMLDVVGFDTDAPRVISDFSMGRI